MDELPTWLADPPAYDPPRDRDGYVRTNALRLVALPSRLAATDAGTAPWDRLLANVTPTLRLAGLLVAVACTSLATNMAFVWIVLAFSLVSLATRPTGQLRAIAVPSFVATLVAGIIVVPGALMGIAPASSVVRIATKTFCTVCLTLGFSQGVPWHRLAASLAAVHVPAILITVVDASVRGIATLGRTASLLLESLSLRSVGRDRTKSASVGGVLGMTFVRAGAFAHAQAEAMDCRGYDGGSTVAARRGSVRANVVYVIGMCAVLGAFVWLELAMGARV